MRDSSYAMIRTVDARMKQVLDIAENIATSRATVLISGESGTGKELLARFIHAKSHRALRRMVAINCAAVPEGLLESELFGFERGAFTGADTKKIGKFELANESSFLLDEISEMPLLLQAKILRVIQEGECERLGGKAPTPVNVRLIATTNRDLRSMVQSGLFREDLFFRLNVIHLHIPPLRERPADVEMLARHFVEISCVENQLPTKSLTPAALKKLTSWRWPGNIRELENTIERSVLLSRNREIEASDLMIEGYQEAIAQKESNALAAGMTISEAEKLLILKTLEHTRQNRTQAARLLGISIRTLRNKLNEYRLDGGLSNEQSF